MKIYTKIKHIVELSETIELLIKELEQQGLETDGFDFRAAYFVRDCVEKDGHLYHKEGHKFDNSGLVDDTYYCNQYTGYLEDDFYGTCYYKTDEQGLFVAVPFSM